MGFCDECGTHFIYFGREGMLDLLLTDFFYSKDDNNFNYAEFLKRYYRQVKETKEFEEKTVIKSWEFIHVFFFLW